MVETVNTDADEDLRAAAQLLHDFNLEYDEPAPPPADLAARLAELVAVGGITVLIARDEQSREPVGVAVTRLAASLWSRGLEMYLAELYVVPDRRGQGHGGRLIREALRLGREAGADYAFLVTSEDDDLAQRAYEATGWRRNEGDGGPIMWAYEQDL